MRVLIIATLVTLIVTVVACSDNEFDKALKEAKKAEREAISNTKSK